MAICGPLAGPDNRPIKARAAMRSVDRYIFFHLLIAMAIAAVVLTFAVWLSQSLNLMEFIIDSAAPLSLFFRMVTLSLPKFLVVVLPVSLIVAVLFVYNHLTVESEMAVLRAAGISPLRLAWPALALALMVTLICYSFTTLLMPMADRQFTTLRTTITSEYSTAFLRDGQFNTVDDDITIYFSERDRAGSLFGLLIHDNRNAEGPVTVIADRGIVQAGESGPFITIFDGNRQERHTDSGKVDILYFERYSLEIDLAQPMEESGWLRPRERFVGQLLHPDMDNPVDRNFALRLIANGHERLSVPLMALGFAGIALGAILGGETNRRGQGRRLTSAVILAVGLQVASLAVANAARSTAALYPVMYALPLLAFICGLAFMHITPHRWQMLARARV